MPDRSPLPAVELQTLDGRTERLDAYAGRVLLVVNVASQCGYTPQYAGLEALYRRHQEQGFVVLAFPCNQFGSQEPGTPDEIRQFCSVNYDVTFPVFARIDVNGAGTHPIYKWLKSGKPGLLGTEAIKWNFTKFLVSRDGHVIRRYAPKDTPESLEAEVRKAIEIRSSSAGG
ncbi:MAG TPA: glutathione peroxidase [Vicinamibacterales bacterium]|nr:glutathione peroxidase [Vicinamibacterales bacterium]